MKYKHQFRIIVLVIIIMIFVFYSFGQRYVAKTFTDKSWIDDLGYEDNQIHTLKFNWSGKRSCPEIPVEIENKTFELGFDTGCGVGIFFTNVIENEIEYTLLGKSEALNRDGSHRGWDKKVIIDKFTVFEDTYKNIESIISDWTMYSSEEFNGTIGLAYFKSKVITLDYKGHRIAVSSNPIEYENLDKNKYIVLPLYHSTNKRQEDLPFFKAEYKGRTIMIYLDTGKNYSYVYNLESKNSMTEKPTNFVDIPIKLADIEIMLTDMVEANNIAQAEGLPFPTIIEMNSDQIWKNNLLITFDLIKQKIIFSRL